MLARRGGESEPCHWYCFTHDDVSELVVSMDGRSIFLVIRGDFAIAR
jgi:hypothetical protein